MEPSFSAGEDIQYKNQHFKIIILLLTLQTMKTFFQNFFLNTVIILARP